MLTEMVKNDFQNPLGGIASENHSRQQPRNDTRGVERSTEPSAIQNPKSKIQNR
jgi:hypothetical protein